MECTGVISGGQGYTFTPLFKTGVPSFSQTVVVNVINFYEFAVLTLAAWLADLRRVWVYNGFVNFIRRFPEFLTRCDRRTEYMYMCLIHLYPNFLCDITPLVQRIVRGSDTTRKVEKKCAASSKLILLRTISVTV